MEPWKITWSSDFKKLKSEVNIAAIPDPNNNAASQFSKSAIFFERANWFGVLKYRDTYHLQHQ
jgi:hypothetical protein